MTDFHSAALPASSPRRRLLLLPLLLLLHGSLFLLSGPGNSWRSQASKPARVAVPMLLLKPRKAPAPPSRPVRAMRAVPVQRIQIEPAPMPVVIAPVAAMPATPTATPAEAGSAETSDSAGAGSGAGRSPLVISLPRSGRPGEFSPSYNPAAHDPRSNSIRLTFSEKMALATGNAECFLEERNPDGSIFRGPGRLVSKASASALAGVPGAGGGRVEICVR